MPLRRTVLRGPDLEAQLAELRAQMKVPGDFPPTAISEAEQAAGRGSWEGSHVDARDVELVTLDPAGSRDLDQAFALSQRPGGGFDFAYAIADVASFVQPGGAIDVEAHARGETLYLPDGRVPLHPPALSEGAASLLPGEERPAVLWRFVLDSNGEPKSVDVRRALVRSRTQFDYATFEQRAGDLVPLLREVGELRQARERDRGGVSLPVPEQEVVCEDGEWVLHYRAPVPAEGWNAQLSLLTGMAAARLMLDAGVGLLRTMPPPDDRTVASLRRSAHGLGVDWPEGASYAEVVRALDATVPAEAALLRLASVLFRGATYVAFDGSAPGQIEQSAVAAPYAHTTAPLRRLIDRYVLECCLTACAGQEVPEWVRAALPALPKEMAEADHRAHEVDRGVVDLAESLVLAHRVGERFTGVVVEGGEHGEVQLRDPAVRGRLTGESLPLGEEGPVRLTKADVSARRVEFSWQGGPPS